jgi:hypothetical protein
LKNKNNHENTKCVFRKNVLNKLNERLTDEPYPENRSPLSKAANGSRRISKQL